MTKPPVEEQGGALTSSIVGSLWCCEDQTKLVDNGNPGLVIPNIDQLRASQIAGLQVVLHFCGGYWVSGVVSGGHRGKDAHDAEDADEGQALIGSNALEWVGFHGFFKV